MRRSPELAFPSETVQFLLLVEHQWYKVKGHVAIRLVKEILGSPNHYGIRDEQCRSPSTFRTIENDRQKEDRSSNGRRQSFNFQF